MTKRKIVLTGIKPTGIPHLGNYIGAIRPALDMAKESDYDNYFFIADYHALNAVQDPKKLREQTMTVAATWLALGLDPEKVTFYRQSDVPEIMELCGLLACVTPKGLMNRAHAYKAKVEENQKSGIESDAGVNMGLYNYPILMAADILLFQSDFVPVGKDQVQHIEIARDIARVFNHNYGDTFVLPQSIVDEDGILLPGLDGRKMSKSYNNTIQLFENAQKMKKQINKIVTDSSLPSEPKNPDDSTLFTFYKAFATHEQTNEMRQRFERGIGWGEVKGDLFDIIDQEVKEARERYEHLINHPHLIQEALTKGGEKARHIASQRMKEIKERMGF